MNPDAAWIIISPLSGETKYFDLPDDQVGAVTAFFPSEGDSPEKFKSFASTVEAQFGNKRQHPLSILENHWPPGQRLWVGPPPGAVTVKSD